MTSAPPTPVAESTVEPPVEPVGTTTVALVDDHVVVLGVGAILDPAADLELLGAHASVAELMRACDGRAFPDVVLLGLATNTVNTYVARIRRRLIDSGFTAGSRVDLLRRDQAEGLLPAWC